MYLQLQVRITFYAHYDFSFALLSRSDIYVFSGNTRARYFPAYYFAPYTYLIVNYNVHGSCAPYLTITHLLQKRKDVLSSLKLWVCSGETLTVSLAKEFYTYFPENEYTLCNFYGSTEIMGDVTYHIVSGIDRLENQDKVPIGI